MTCSSRGWFWIRAEELTFVSVQTSLTNSKDQFRLEECVTLLFSDLTLAPFGFLQVRVSLCGHSRVLTNVCWWSWTERSIFLTDLIYSNSTSAESLSWFFFYCGQCLVFFSFMFCLKTDSISHVWTSFTSISHALLFAHWLPQISFFLCFLSLLNGRCSVLCSRLVLFLAAPRFPQPSSSPPPPPLFLRLVQS